MATHFKGTQAETQALNAYITLMRAAESLETRLHQRSEVGRKAGLTPSQFGVMECLFHLGPLCQKEVGAKVLCSRGNITMIVNNLEKRGLLRRVQGEHDRRVQTLHLTEKGSKLIKQLMPQHVDVLRSEMGHLSRQELEQLRTLCRKLGRKEDTKGEHHA